MDPSFLPIDIAVAAIGFYFIWRIFRRRSSVPLPPGPKGLPLIGNVLDLPSEKEWLVFAKWGQTYGDMTSITVFGQTMIILNSARIASEMLDKKSSIYSDRPVLQMGGELVGWKQTLVLLPYGDRFRRVRKLFRSLIGSPNIVKKYWPGQELETTRFLRRVLVDPDNLSNHIRESTGKVVLRISYGIEAKETDDPYIRLADVATVGFADSTVPGKFLVDVLPLLRHVPDWFPGADFKRKARLWANDLLEMVDQPYNVVKEKMATGEAGLSFTSSYLENNKVTAEDETILKWSAASLYSGGADTTVSAIYAFFLAMTLYPEAARNAQEELDRVVGIDRLPVLEDRQNLPYMDALQKEVFRWNSVVPTGVAHRATEDDVHEGYFIPKGALVIPNLWQLTHDPRTYRDPLSFNPDRFIAKDGKAEPDPRQFAFGFGRRICPGMHLADSSLFIICAMSLAVLDISKCVENGRVIEPVHENTSGTISHPKPFRCSIKPRSKRAVALIQGEEL